LERITAAFRSSAEPTDEDAEPMDLPQAGFGTFARRQFELVSEILVSQEVKFDVDRS
jgi:hypothetical protein